MAFHASKLARAYHSAKARLDGIKEKGEEAIGQGLQLCEVGGASFAWSYANQRFGDVTPGVGGELKVVGVPADLAAAVALHGLAFLGAAGKYGEHAHNLADGSLAAYLARMGQKMGAEARKPKTSGHVAGAMGAGNPYGAWAPSYAYDAAG